MGCGGLSRANQIDPEQSWGVMFAAGWGCAGAHRRADRGSSADLKSRNDWLGEFVSKSAVNDWTFAAGQRTGRNVGLVRVPCPVQQGLGSPVRAKFQSVDEARSAFATHGHRFDAPRLSTHVEHADGTITHSPPPPPVPPIFSNESVPRLGDENFVWRGYGNNKRGVIKMRVGRFLADFNLPTVEDAERFARRMVHLLTAQHDERW